MTDIVYEKLLDETYPQAENPPGFKIQLKPHQLTAIHKAIRMEQDDFLKYKTTTNNEFEASTNIGLISDIVGYGKTFTALGIVASASIDNIHQNKDSVLSYSHQGMNLLAIRTKLSDETLTNPFIKTTLIIVPRGPVFLQWIKMIEDNTNLKTLVINDLRTIRNILSKCNSYEKFKEHMQEFDIVLIKVTNYKSFDTILGYHGAIKVWGRIIIDEAHEVIGKVSANLFKATFYWFITGTPHLFQNSSSSLSTTLRALIRNDMIIKNKDEFVRMSFDIPQMREIDYICKMSAKFRAIRGFLPHSIVERINASDYIGAIREMGGTNASIDTMIDILTRNLKKELHNKQCERNMVEMMDMTETEKQIRLNNVDTTIKHIESRLNDLMNRLSEIDNKVCAICMDMLDKPVALECTHLFCSRCILEWIKRKTNPVCPECRTGIAVDKLINVGNDNDTIASSKQHAEMMSKENTMIKIIKDKPNGKFLIFSKIENGFTAISNALRDNNITFSEIKGNTACMKNILSKFRNGDYTVILLTTSYAGSGIDISFATDVIIYHKMEQDKIQAVGRAQRVGREDPLTVHNLLYEHET
eukprot:762836-Hanusia_phi.AAC.9